MASNIEMARRKSLILMLLSSWLVPLMAETGSEVQTLLDKILVSKRYSDKIRPVVDQTSAIEVQIDYNLNSVVDFDEQRGILTTSGFLTIGWFDEYFRWDPRDHNGTISVFVPQTVIWKPDLSLKNSLESYKTLGADNLNLQVFNDGYVLWHPYQVFESTCSPTITKFPFDSQTCDIEFAMWSYSRDQVQLTIGNGEVSGRYANNSLWDLLEFTTLGENDVGNSAVFRVELKRKPRFVIINIVIPVMLLSVINIFTFCLPVTSGERAGYAITSFLSLAVFFTIVSDQLPENSENTSQLAVYLMAITTLSTVNVIVSIIELRIFSWDQTDKPVGSFYRYFVSFCNFKLCRSKCRNTRIKNDEMAENRTSPVPEEISHLPTLPSSDEKNSLSPTWFDVVNGMDVLCFVFSLMFTICCNVMLMVW